jgi:hypothetical protein
MLGLVPRPNTGANALVQEVEDARDIRDRLADLEVTVDQQEGCAMDGRPREQPHLAHTSEEESLVLARVENSLEAGECGIGRLPY